MCILLYETEELLERHVTSLFSLSARSALGTFALFLSLSRPSLKATVDYVKEFMQQQEALGQLLFPQKRLYEQKRKMLSPPFAGGLNDALVLGLCHLCVWEI